MSIPEIRCCPGTLAANHQTYSITCLRRMFHGRRVTHVLPYGSPATDETTATLFIENRKRISISGVQEKFSVLLEKNKLRLTEEREQGMYILKPIPQMGKNADQMPANEHLTMQIARQVFHIETAENVLIFFKNGAQAYLTRRFDVTNSGSKWASEDFASLGGRSPQTHGENYKYQGNYLQLFELLKQFVPAYQIEVQKLYQLILFNYLFSNGDAHFKNFSLLETPNGDFRLSPAYDLLNTRMHISDADFALEEGLVPKKSAQGKILTQFHALADLAGLSLNQRETVIAKLLSGSSKVTELIKASYMSDRAKRNYLQDYQTRYKKLTRD